MTHCSVLQNLSRIKPEFVPYFLNFLRDQSAAILQGCRSANATPSKTPTVLKTQRSITFDEPNRKTSTPRNQNSSETKRVQLFAASPLEGDSFIREQSHDNSSLISPTKNTSGNIYGSPGPSSWSLYNSGANTSCSPVGGQYRRPGQRHGRSTPNDSVNSSWPHQDHHRSQHKNCLGDFLITSSSRKKKSPSAARRDENSPHGGRMSGGKGKGDRRPWQLMSPSEVSGGRVFTLANTEEFPTLGETKRPEESPSPCQ